MITFRVKLMSFSGYAGGIHQSLGNGTKLNPLRKSHDREWPSQEQSSIQCRSPAVCFMDIVSENLS
jgi:hypothetical protein